MRKTLFTALLGVSAGLLQAASPLATLSTSGTVVVSGTELSASAVTVWPVVAGDEVATKDTSAVLIINGKSRVTLSPNSKVKVASEKGRTIVTLLDGFVNYVVAENANLAIRSQASPSKVIDSGTGALNSAGDPVPVQRLKAEVVSRTPVKASNSF